MSELRNELMPPIYNENGQFECCCISLQNRRFGLRTYQTAKSFRSDPDRLPPAVRRFIQDTEINKGLKLFDLSVRGTDTTERNKAVYSVSFYGRDEGAPEFLAEMSDHSCVANFEDVLRSRIVDCFHTVDNPVIQVGFLLDGNGDVLEKKTYFTLNNASKERNPERRMALYMAVYESASELYKNLFGEGTWKKILPIHDFCTANQMRPFMIGLNKKKCGSTENKLYFLNEPISRADRDVEKTLLSLIHENQRGLLSEYFDQCRRQNLYMRGLGISIKNQAPYWRFYWFQRK